MRKYVAYLFAFSVCLLQGCVPGVGWFPDSSGFVYTTSKGHLVVYDLATKTNRVILKDPAAATTCWPAVSPSGKRIALAHLQDSDDKKDALLQFVICDLQGKIEFRSARIKLVALAGKDLEYSTQIVWSPDEKKILAHGQAFANEGTGFDCAILFDIAAGKARVWDQHAPAYFGGSPIRPDGAGFLLSKRGQDDAHVRGFLWVDWDGSQKSIPITKQDGGEPIPPYPVVFDSRWEGASAVVTLARVRYVIDTPKLQQTMEPVRESDRLIGKEFVRRRTAMGNGLELFMLQAESKPGEGPLESGPPVRVVARKRGESQLREVIRPMSSDQIILLDLSPDRKHAIVRTTYGGRGSKGDTIHVINADGRLHDMIDVFEKFVEKR